MTRSSACVWYVCVVPNFLVFSGHPFSKTHSQPKPVSVDHAQVELCRTLHNSTQRPLIYTHTQKSFCFFYLQVRFLPSFASRGGAVQLMRSEFEVSTTASHTGCTVRCVPTPRDATASELQSDRRDACQKTTTLLRYTTASHGPTGEGDTSQGRGSQRAQLCALLQTKLLRLLDKRL